MEDESRFYVGFYCGFRSTQPTVGIESFYQTHVKIGIGTSVDLVLLPIDSRTHR